jgi:hypothetical protein
MISEGVRFVCKPRVPFIVKTFHYTFELHLAMEQEILNKS